MTNKEKYKKAFSVVQPSGEMNLEVEKMCRKNKCIRKPAVITIVCCCLLAVGSVAAYAADLGGIQRTIQIWMHGDQTDAVLEFDQEKGTYSMNYTDENGEEKNVSGGGVAFDANGKERPVTEEELMAELDSPEVEYKEDGTVWVYYHDQTAEITDKFEDGVCYVKLLKNSEPLYMTVKYQNGYAISSDKYISPREFN